MPASSTGTPGVAPAPRVAALPGASSMPNATDPPPSRGPDGAAATAEYKLPTAGFEGTPEQIEQQWYEQCYVGRGDSMWQLTWRAVLMGSLLGGILSLTNLYIGLKTGWGFGVAITACILSYAIWTTLWKIGLVGTKMTVLENNCMQSTASSAGYSTGGTLVSAIAAFIIVNGESIPTLTLMAWVFFLAVLGVTMAIPMKRQMINVEQLRFPSGVAAAQTLQALHSTGGRGMASAKALGLAGLFGIVSKLWTEGVTVMLGAKAAAFQLGTWIDKFNTAVIGTAWTGRTVMFSWEPMFIAAGAITGLRACASMLLGGTLCWMVYVPIMQSQGVIEGSGYRDIVQWTLWGGAACMVTSGLLSFGLQWRSALRAFTDLAKMFSTGKRHTDEAVDKIETPAWWFIAGQIFGLAGLAYLGVTTFNMPVWLTIFAVLLSFALALVACRVCGETDTTPVGAMGKITQLTFGAVRPGDMNVNLMGACITAGAADSSSDLLIDLKSGYLLGANPRKQFIAQFAGIFAGTLVSVLTFNLVVHDANILGSDQFPAPAAQAWSAVAIALSKGLSTLAAPKVWAIIVGGAVGIVLPLLERAFPKQRQYVPSAAAIGLAWTFHWYYSALFFTGAVIGYIIEKKYPKFSEAYTFPVASGVIAGESLMGVGLIFIEFGPEMFDQLRASFGG
jgi:OPT family oligopeptide transporter